MALFNHAAWVRKRRTTICVRQVWFRNEQFRNLPFTQEELPQSLGSSARTSLTSELSVRLLAMAWYCPKCKTNFTEYQPMCPFCNVRLGRSSLAFGCLVPSH